MTAQLDFLVIGDDEPSLCAAACAAKAGAAVGLVRAPGKKKGFQSATAPGIPNDVWRRLDLHEYDLHVDPVSAQVTLLAEDAALATHAGARETSEALARAGVHDGSVWADFIEETRDLAREEFVLTAGSGVPADAAAQLSRMFADPHALDRAARLSGSCRETLDDIFTDERLKNHVCAHALAPSGLGGAEAGSAYALLDWSGEEAWRVRPEGGAKALHAVLEKACKKAGVDFYDGPAKPIPSRSARYKALTVNGHDKLRTRYIFFATPLAAEQAGAADANAVFAGGRSVNVVMRFKLTERIVPPSGDVRALFQIIDSASDLRRARDAAVCGKLPERLPIEFEFTDKGDILARTAYCPAAFCEEGEWRGWTSQDRQAVAARIKERLVSRMPALAEAVRSTRIDVAGPSEEVLFTPSDRIIVQPGRHNAIAAAVNLIDKVMNGAD